MAYPTRMSERSGLANIGILGGFFFLSLFLVLIFLQVPFNTSFLIVMGAVIFTAAFLNTEIALIILIFSMLLSPEYSAGSVTGRSIKIRADDVFLIVIFFGWMAKMAVNKELGTLKATRLNTPILAYLGVCFLSSFFAILQGHLTAKESFFYILKYLEYFMLFFMVVNNLKSVRQARRFLFFIFLTCFFVTIYGLVQAQTVERISAPFESSNESNTFAGYLILMLGLIMGSILYPAPVVNRYALVGLLGITGAALLMTLSRSGWVSFFFMFLTVIVLNRKFRTQLILLFIIGVILMPVLAPRSVHKRVADTFIGPKTYKMLGSRFELDESGQARIDTWADGINRWTRYPVLGNGVPCGTFFDNQYIRVLNETGIVGFCLFTWILLTIFGVVRRTYLLMRDDDFAQALCVGFLASYAGLLVFSTASAAFTIIRIMEPFWFVLGVIVVLPDIAASEPGEDAYPARA